MVEIELKSVVNDWDTAIARVEGAGAELVFAGRLEDRLLDTPDRALTARDHVLRIRTYRDAGGERAELHWKGPTTYQQGFKHREELGASIGGSAALSILQRLGYDVASAIDRDVRQYRLLGATVRFERYPRMDALVEVEGTVEQIERAIAATGLPRGGFTGDRLAVFVKRFESRTGRRALTSDAAAADAAPQGRRDG